jgi:SAM-dependent methyltransferase
VIDLGKVFRDEEVVRLYRHRPPYPRAVFDLLTRLIVEPRAVLDAGCGTGAVARGLVDSAARIDAVDPSPAMLAAARGQPHGDDPRISWQLARAEDARLDGPYGLITCGASLHWMRTDVVLPRFKGALAPGARVAIVDTEAKRAEDGLRREVIAIIQRYSPLGDHIETPEMVDRIMASGAFVLEGRERTEPVPFEQSVDDYIAFLGSTSTLSRATLGPRAGDFSRDLREVFARHGVDRVRYGVVGYVAWGTPA